MNPEVNHFNMAFALSDRRGLFTSGRQWVGRTQKVYILLSHVLGRNWPNPRPDNRVYIEKLISHALQEGLYAPFHIKTLKMLTGNKQLGSCALGFLQLLRTHAKALLNGRTVVLVVDELAGLGTSELEQVQRLLAELATCGYKVLLQHGSSELVPLNHRYDQPGGT